MHGHELLRAAFLGDIDLVRRLTSTSSSEEPQQHRACCREGQCNDCWSKSTALVEACSMGHVCIVQYLIGSGVDVNERNEAGVSPLWAAAGRECPRVVEVLLEHGANPTATDAHGNTPLMRSAWGAKLEVVRCLLRHPAVGVNVMNKDGCTALWFAAFYGRIGVARVLLEAGADWKVGKDPYALAVAEGRHGIRSLLEEAERCYLLHKSRLVCDNSLLASSGDPKATACIPACLTARWAGKKTMPYLQEPSQEKQDYYSSSGRKREWASRKRRRVEEQKKQVLFQVVSDLKPELFIELGMMMGWK